MAARNVTSTADISRSRADTDSTTLQPDTQPRFRLYRLCACFDCAGTGKVAESVTLPTVGAEIRYGGRCPECRGEGKVKQEVATAATPADVGVALVTLAREGEFADCPFGLLDTQGETGLKWLVSMWLPSPRNVSDAGRVLAQSRHTKEREN